MRLFSVSCLPLVALLGVIGQPLTGSAGMIEFAGDLLQSSFSTPALLGSGASVDLPFSMSIPEVGLVSGNVHVMNDAGMAGLLRLEHLQFQSLRPAGAGDVTFRLSIEQDFAYAGPPRVDGALALHGSATLTAAGQRASGFVAGLVGIVLDPLPFSFTADPQVAFPQQNAFGTAGLIAGLSAEPIMSLQLTVSLLLSDQVLSPGPRFDGTGPDGEFVSLRYGAAPVPEPRTQTLLGLGALCVLGSAWRWLRAYSCFSRR